MLVLLFIGAPACLAAAVIVQLLLRSIGSGVLLLCCRVHSAALLHVIVEFLVGDDAALLLGTAAYL
jgi:hypothetical protein